MRRRVLIFLSVALCFLMVAPIANFLSSQQKDRQNWQNKKFLYNMDFASKWLSRVLYPLGISTDPEQVVIGRDGWFYLGDKHSETQSVARRGQTAADIALGQRIGAATLAWDYWLASKGVRLFRVMIGPNKETIYPEHLPAWAKPSSATATDALLAGTDPEHYIDLRAPLLAAKVKNKEFLYYPTDTHWNSLGGGLAFRAFAQEVGRSMPELRWPANEAFEVSSVASRDGGDLVNFLRLSKDFHDPDPLLNATSLPVETTLYDFDSREVLRKGGNPQVVSLQKPLLIKSVGALNAKKVLWLRDSFGAALAPLMAATFAETVQLQWGAALTVGGRFVELVEKWKPDYVFVTVVERDARNEIFAASPPVGPVVQPKEFKPVRTTSPSLVNQLTSIRPSSRYKLNGVDPYIDYALSAPLDAMEVPFLSFQLFCADNADKIPMQFFWLKEGKDNYDEEHSVRFTAGSGAQVIDLRTVPGWIKSGTIKRLRLDMDSQNTCSVFTLNNPTMGVLPSRK